MEICKNCGKLINAKDKLVKEGDEYVHVTCPNKRKEIDLEKSTTEEIDLEKSTTGSSITDIHLPFGSVLTITFQFFIAGLILSIPIWIIFMIAFSLNP